MEVSKTVTPEGDVTLEIEISKSDLGSVFTDALKEFQSQASIPGFRPGKVPLSHVKQRWGKAILTEKAEETARKHLSDILKEQDLTPGGRIDIDLIEFGEDKPLRFKVDFPLDPVVALDKYKGLEVTINDAEVTEEDVDAQIEGIRHKHAMLKSIDTPSTPGAKLSLQVQEVDSSGLALIGRKVEEIEFEFGTDRLGIGSDEQILGLKAGDKRLVTTREPLTSLTTVSDSPKIIKPGEEKSGSEQALETTYSVEVMKVEIPELPDLDENLAKEVNETLSSVEDLKKFVKINLMDFVASTSRRELEQNVIAKLLTENNFSISPKVINTTLEEIAEKIGLKDEQLAAFMSEHFAEAEKDFRWVRLRDEIANTEKIEVTDTELDESISRVAELSGDKADEVRQRYEAQDERDRLRQRYFESKVIEVLTTNASVTKRKLSLKEFLHTSHDHEH